MGTSRCRRRWPAIVLTLLTASLFYGSAVLWAWWTGPEFDLSGLDDGRAVSPGGRNGSIAWPIAVTALACCAIVATTVAWRSALEQAERRE